MPSAPAEGTSVASLGQYDLPCHRGALGLEHGRDQVDEPAAQPHSLSYHANTLESHCHAAIVSRESTIAEKGLPDHVARDERLIGVLQDSGQPLSHRGPAKAAFTSSTVVGREKVDTEIDERSRWDRGPHGDAVEFPREFGNDEPDRLGGPGRSGNEVDALLPARAAGSLCGWSSTLWSFV